MTLMPLSLSTWDVEEIEAIVEVLKSGNLTMGKLVEEFESSFADYSGTKHAVMFNSGSSANLALLFALKYLYKDKLPEDSEFIVPAVSWSTTFFPVVQAGFKLKFVDIDGGSLNINPNRVREAITSNTKAIFAVNLLGNPASLIELKQIADDNNLTLIEDNCESLGAELNGKLSGTYGLAGTYSFFYSHHICTMEGGMVTTDSLQLSQYLKSVRAHGWTRGLPKENFVHNLTGDEWSDRFRFVIPGFNLRPLEVSAAAGIVQMKKFNRFLQVRRTNAEYFKKLFSSLNGVRIQTENGHSSWFGFSIVLEGNLQGKRSELVKVLETAGIETRPIVTGNFLKNPVISLLNHEVYGPLDNADDINDNGLFFGNHHIPVERELDQIASLIRDFERKVTP